MKFLHVYKCEYYYRWLRLIMGVARGSADHIMKLEIMVQSTQSCYLLRSGFTQEKKHICCRGRHFVSLVIVSYGEPIFAMGGASGVAVGGDCCSCICPSPPATPPSREKNCMCPFDPSRPLSQRKVYVKIHEMCQNTAQSCWISFYFRSLTAKAPAASFPQLKVR